VAAGRKIAVSGRGAPAISSSRLLAVDEAVWGTHPRGALPRSVFATGPSSSSPPTTASRGASTLMMDGPEALRVRTDCLRVPLVIHGPVGQAARRRATTFELNIGPRPTIAGRRPASRSQTPTARASCQLLRGTAARTGIDCAWRPPLPDRRLGLQRRRTHRPSSASAPIVGSYVRSDDESRAPEGRRSTACDRDPDEVNGDDHAQFSRTRHTCACDDASESCDRRPLPASSSD
jgi:hypothetical protein